MFMTKKTYTQFLWFDHIKQILVASGFDCVWENERFSSIDSLCRNVKHSLLTSFQNEWLADLENSSKCLFYKNYKSSFKAESYISLLPDSYVIPLMKFRCGNHKLAIELGRH